MRLLIALHLATYQASALPQSAAPCTLKTAPIGGGDPHQNYLELQVSETKHCKPDSKNPNCKVLSVERHTEYFFTGTTVPFEWTAGGFDVNESTITRADYLCNTDKEDDICVYATIPHTAYTVQNQRTCDGPVGKPFVIQSPNKNPAGIQYYCVRGAGCHSKGKYYWSGRIGAGGPP